MKKTIIMILVLVAALASCKKTPEVNLKYVDVERDLVTVGTTTANIQCDYEYISTLKKAYLYYGEGEDEADMNVAEMHVVQKTLYVEMVGLKENTTYHYYYEFANGFNSMRSAAKTFKTEGSGTTITLPTVVTAEVTEITTTSAKSGGEVTNDGGAEVTERGICWGTNANPTLSDSHIAAGTGIGAFVAMMNGLEVNTTYHVRAYATNEVGTAYGLDREFVTTGSGSGVPEGAIDGLFSVSPTQKVYFSQGNLQYQASTNTWRFAEHQWDYVGSEVVYQGDPGGNVIGSSNHLISEVYDGWIDLFGWGTSGYNHGAICYQPWSTSSNWSDYYAYGSPSANLYDNTGQADWGYNPIINGGNVECIWRTLKQEEMGYVFYSRGVEVSFVRAVVNGVKGVVLLPDDWEATNYQFNSPNVGNNPYSDNVISSIIWSDVLEPKGAVFFPAAGLRRGSGVALVNSWGQYALSTAYDKNQVFRFGFDEEITVPNDVGSSWRDICFSVRLAQNVTMQPSIQIPTVVTSNVSSITANSAACGGEVTNDGGASVSERGICWSTNENPTLIDNHVAIGTGMGAFNFTITSLEPNTTYHVRAYATNEKGTAYGLDREFTTIEGGGSTQDKYFTIESLEDNNTITLNIPRGVDSQYLTSVSYSTDGTIWTTLNIDATDQTISVTLNQGETVCYKGQGLQYAKGWEEDMHSCFNTSGNITVSGNIMSLLYGDDFANKTEFPSGTSHTFERLFYGTNKLVSAGSLLLPATSLAYECYREMFRGCSFLTNAPMLPAISLANGCYNCMFMYCTSLMEAPTLSATTLADLCYYGMFWGSASLTKAPTLPATIMANQCYRYMFLECTALTEAPALPATVLSEQCYYEMFRDCTSLKRAPVLPATTLADWCYQGMFEACAITEAPALPATTLKYHCYAGMFNFCSSLTEAPALPAIVLAEACYWNMFQGCTSLTIAPTLPATTLEDHCYCGMFANCTSLGEVTCLATNILAADCTTNWLYGVSSGGTFYKNAAMSDWPLNSDSGIPNGWNVVNY